jgi:hypothetical protein
MACSGVRHETLLELGDAGADAEIWSAHLVIEMLLWGRYGGTRAMFLPRHQEA